MRKVAIIGIGQTPVYEHWERSLRKLAGEAIFSALGDAGFESADALFIGNMLSGLLEKQEQLGTLIADWVGLRGIEAMKIEAACGSGAAAFRSGVMAVASGEIESALVVGVEKMTDALPSETTAALATAGDADWEIIQGLSFVGINALVMQRYMAEYGWRREDFAMFSVNAHANAVHNPNARFQKPITKETYLNAQVVSSPINVMDASPIGDGAAAALLVPADRIQASRINPKITVAGSSAATDTLAVHDRQDPLWLKAAELSSKRAYAMAGINEKDIDFFEYHDAFSIMAALSLESCGFAERGQGPRMALENKIHPGGELPVATLGGLKARGHPVGATGMYQIVEAVQQLRGEAGETQVADARIGLAQNIGGSGATIVTHILEKHL